MLDNRVPMNLVRCTAAFTIPLIIAGTAWIAPSASTTSPGFAHTVLALMAFALMLVLTLGLISIVGAGSREAQLDPGVVPSPDHIRRALELIADGTVTASHIVNHEEPLSRLPQVLSDLAHHRNGQIKTAIVP